MALLYRGPTGPVGRVRGRGDADGGADADADAGGEATSVRRSPGDPCWRMCLLGGFRLWVGAGRVQVPASPQRILAFLALRGPSGRSRVAGSLWPDTSESNALARLRTGLWRARQAAPGVVRASRDSVGIARGVEVDVQGLVRTARTLLDEPATADVAAVVTDCADGELLPDWNDDWLTDDRERLRQLRLHVLESLAARLASTGGYAMAMEAALAARRGDPLRESAHRSVIRVHASEGNLVEAFHAYQECRTVLARELGIEPSEETTALVRRLGVVPAAARAAG